MGVKQSKSERFKGEVKVTGLEVKIVLDEDDHLLTNALRDLKTFKQPIWVMEMVSGDFSVEGGAQTIRENYDNLVEDFDENKAMEEIKKLFENMDTNGDGTISKEEMISLFSELNDYTESEYDSMFNSADADKDGSVNYKEFIDWVFSEGKPTGQDSSEPTSPPGLLGTTKADNPFPPLITNLIRNIKRVGVAIIL